MVGAYTLDDSAPALAPGRDEDVLYTLGVQLRPRTGNASVVPLALTILHAAIAQQWPDAPPLLRTGTVNRDAERFAGLQWTTRQSADFWTGELLWRHPHPETSGAPCTTHLILTEHGSHTRLALRVTADKGLTSVRGIIGAGLARPAFVDALQAQLRVLFEGIECTPHILTVHDMPSFVRNVLLGERAVPIAVLSPLENGSYMIEPQQLGHELCGLAHVYVMDRHPTSYALSDEIGDRRLSCYWGAMRVYMPHFSCADRPDEHPLLQNERVADPIERAHLLGNLARYAQRWVRDFERNIARDAKALSPARAEILASSVTAVPEITGAAPVTEAPASDAANRDAPVSPTSSVDGTSTRADHAPIAHGADRSLDPTLAALGAHVQASTALLTSVLPGIERQLQQLTDVLQGMAESNRALVEEIARLRNTAPIRSAGSSAADRRMQSLEQSVKSVVTMLREGAPTVTSPSHEPIEDVPDDERIALIDVVRQAAASHPETLLILEAAEHATVESPYVEAERLAQLLEIMAEIADRRRSGALSKSLREVFKEYGVEYRGGIAPSTSEKMRRQYVNRGPDGTEYECHEHIVLGSGYDPRYCLRVYFTTRAPLEPRFVIGHIGRHLDVKSTT
ncbi:MAG: hypothetical protein ACO1Q7_16215 [Gemmatimonas sp.]